VIQELLALAGIAELVSRFGKLPLKQVVEPARRLAQDGFTATGATLRVLGFSRAEVSWILLGELGFLVLVSLPLGFLAGYLLCVLMATGLQSDLFRVPVHITSETYAFAAITVVVSTVLSSLIVRLRIQRLDLVEVLKTRE